MKTTFTKILDYELYPIDPTIDLFTHVCDVLKQDINPKTKCPNQLRVNTDIIFSSPLLRARQCIKQREGLEVHYLNELSEIPFDLQRFCSAKEWESRKSAVVRKAFKDAFIADQFLLSRQVVREQIERVFRIARNNPNSTMVSHTFRLALIRAYSQTKGEIFKNPQLIHRYVFEEKKTFIFGESFKIDS